MNIQVYITFIADEVSCTNAMSYAPLYTIDLSKSSAVLMGIPC